MKKCFDDVAMREGNPKWDKMISRQHPIYARNGDVRSDFARDYTRILHSLAYRRLKHKTQVFYNAAGNDHICTRIEHVQHVESVSNTIANSLGLNEDLTKAIAMAHDLGHAPFGHQGEKIISNLTEKYLGKKFWHEQNGVYFVDCVELLEDDNRYLQNLNLSYAVRDGIISHCGELDQNALRPREELFELTEFDAPGKYNASTWEGCVVKLADKIAYLGRDIEDAIRLGFLDSAKQEELLAIAQGKKATAINTTVIMHNMIIDLCNNSNPDKGLCLSDKMSELLNEIKRFNYENIYANPKMAVYTKYSRMIIEELFDALISCYRGEDTIRYLDSTGFADKGFIRGFAEWLVQYCDIQCADLCRVKEIASRCNNIKIYGNLNDEKQYIQSVIDFIAGMTDTYAIKAFNELLEY